MWYPCLSGEGYQSELLGDVICKLLLPRRGLQNVSGCSVQLKHVVSSFASQQFSWSSSEAVVKDH